MPGIILLLALMQQLGGEKPPVGQILIATAKSHDPDLGKSLVLVIHSDRDGAMGLILNKPGEHGTYFGGPIAMGVRALVEARSKPEGGLVIRADVFLVSKESAIPKSGRSRVYAGYVGWSAQQLSDEIALGLWKIAPGDAKIIFDPHPETLWQRISR